MKLILPRTAFNPIYLPLLEPTGKRYHILFGSAGSGKSYFIAQMLIVKALREKRKILVLRKVGRTVKNSVFQLLLDTLTDWKIIDKCGINRTDFTITLPNGSVFLCSGLDDPEKIKSITGLTDAWMEEATEFNQDDFNQIDLRIRHPKAEGQTLTLSFNPVSKANWCYTLFFQPTEDKDLMEFREKCFILKTTYMDNKHLPQEYINSLLALKATNPAYYSIYALGEFGSLDKLIYNNWQIAEINPETIKGQLLVGLDFGYTNDPTALTVSLLDTENRRIYIYDTWGGTGYTNTEIARVIKDKGLAKSTIIADSAEMKSIDEIKLEGIRRIKPSVKGQGSILQGIQKLQQYELVVAPECKELIEELQNYSWIKDKKTNEYINTPVDKYNHYLDALRYSLQCVEDNKLKTLNKTMLSL